MGCAGSKKDASEKQITTTREEPKEKKVHEYKVLILGDAAVGKSSLVVQYVEGYFPEKYVNSLQDDDYSSKKLVVEDNEIKLVIWDTAGQERFRTITGSFYKGTSGVAICYDIGNKKSFDRLDKWFEQSREYGPPNLPAVLFGTKLDSNERAVSLEEAKAYAEKMKVPYVETSAKTNQNVELAFTTLAKTIFEHKRKEEESD